MANYIIIVILLIILLLALRRAKKHLKGGCCSSGSTTIRDKKTLSAPKLGEKVMSIEGMRCENCEIRISNALNRLQNVACTVSWRKKTAIVSYSADFSDQLLKSTVEKLGYKVTNIEQQ